MPGLCGKRRLVSGCAFGFRHFHHFVGGGGGRALLFPCFGFCEILPVNADGDTHFRKAVIYPGVGGVLQVLQFFQREVRCHD